MAATWLGLTAKEANQVSQIRTKEREAVAAGSSGDGTVGALISGGADIRSKTSQRLRGILGEERYRKYRQELTRARRELAKQEGHDDLPRTLNPNSSKTTP